MPEPKPPASAFRCSCSISDTLHICAPDGAFLPPRCILCNSPDVARRQQIPTPHLLKVQKNLHPAKPAPICHAYFCEQHRLKLVKPAFTVLAVVILYWFALLAEAITWFMPTIPFTILLTIPVVALLAWFVHTKILFPTPLRIAHYDGKLLHLTGASEPFIAALPTLAPRTTTINPQSSLRSFPVAWLAAAAANAQSTPPPPTPPADSPPDPPPAEE